ncbi:MAG TPA: hypothetical protein VGX92_02975 [Pyrinomonadaceae bacterium]|jgi:hypothetical protein|nr:hypothetical protein [Pyrinomonadaceae bacterium]
MRKTLVALTCAGLSLFMLGVAAMPRAARMEPNISAALVGQEHDRRIVPDEWFDVDVLVDGRPLEEYAARGRRYVEALEGAEYELRVRNPLGVRVAVALSVDGLNTIDARRTSAMNASKWVIEPYQTITIRGWQMSSERARRFYFTSERDSYGAKLGQTANLGVISAVFFRERQPVVIAPPPRDPYPVPLEKDGRVENRREPDPQAGSSVDGVASSRQNRAEATPAPDDEYPATGIGRNVHNDVRWVNLELQPRPVSEVTIRYEYRAALVRLGILPRPYPPHPDALRRRENSSGFEDRRYSPEP